MGAAIASGAPHEAQNRAPSDTVRPQFGQNIAILPGAA
jgi:hypothetical protein